MQCKKHIQEQRRQWLVLERARFDRKWRRVSRFAKLKSGAWQGDALEFEMENSTVVRFLVQGCWTGVWMPLEGIIIHLLFFGGIFKDDVLVRARFIRTITQFCYSRLR